MYAATFLALASVAIAAPLAAPRAESTKATPAHWAVGYLEKYQVYHTRYLALDCQSQHNTTFFDDCCRPMLATENLADDRKPYCTPNATAVSSASEYEATAYTASVTASADVEAESEYCEAVNSTTAYGSASATWSSVAAAETSEVANAQAQIAHVSSAAPTSEWVAPTTTSTWEAPAQTSEAAKEETHYTAPSGDVKTGGYATFFYQNGNPGACGQYHSDNDKIVAIDGNGYWSDFSQASSHCGKWVNIKNTQNGKTVTAMVADVCPTCVSDNSLDLSVGAFNAIAAEWEGSVPIEWSWA